MRGPHCRRRSSPLLLAAVALWAGLAADAATQGNAASDRAALEALYDATGGPGWTDSTNWNTSAPIGEWFGVSTDAAGRVTRLSLRGNDLTGSIPAELGNLVSLRSLDLTDNDLTGPIPSELGRLVNLEWLSLWGNALTGPVPAWLGNLTGLRSLDLGGNALTGPVPAWLGNLTGLRSLHLGGNDLTGPVPVELGSLANLESLNLGGNALTGPVPAWLGNLTGLRSLDLGGNDLTGPVPVELGSLANLESLNLGGNALTGPVPAWLGNLTGLRSLDLGRNALTGPIPSELGRLVNLERLGLWGNALTGPVPAWLGNLTGLRSLDLGGNDLTGPVPVELGSLANLESLNLWGNALTGPVPAWLGNLTGLQGLSLGGNDLTGPVPVELGSLANLESLNLGGNALAGPVPAWLGNLTGLRSLHLGGNDLTGPVPVELGSLANLESLDLGSNGLTGPVPAWLGNLTGLQGLSLGGNDLTGPVPVELGSLANLESLDLGSNGLTGPIPGELGSLANLESLDLGSNGLTGPIPGELGSLANLESLNLQFNPLTGSLPQSLTQLSQLMRLDVSHTAACAPADVAFQEWLATIDFRGESCNRPPEPVDTVPPQVLTESGPALGVSMETYFSDPDDDPLTYVAASGHAGTVTALASGDTVWLVPGAAGTATVTVTAGDPGGLSATQTMTVTTAASAGPQSDREVLEVLYDGTGGPGWTNRRNWKTSAPLDQWYGVTTDTAGRVMELRLDDNGLTGPIPGALERLANLRWLHLDGNALTGAVPAWLGNLVRLRTLGLSRNDLTGPIPDELESLANLEHLDLGGNALTGAVPAWLGNLGRLRTLSLWRNDLTGPIPDELGSLANLEHLYLGGNAVTGAVPAWLGNLGRLRTLSLWSNDLTGPIPDELGSLANLEQLNLSYNWGLSGPLPPGLQLSRLEKLEIFVTQACMPAALQDWLETIEFSGQVCGSGTDVTIDVAIVHTPAAREAAGGTAAIEAVTDLWIAEANQAFKASGVDHRLALVARSEVAYNETGDSLVDIRRLANSTDGYMDEVHAMRDRVGADLVYLVVGESDAARGNLGGPFGLTCQRCGGSVFTHEVGHNMGISHDRYQVHHNEGEVSPHPAYGYVNQRAVEAGAPRSRRWRTRMASNSQCIDAYTDCLPSGLLRFSNPRQSYNGDPLGIPFGKGSGVTGPADAAAVLNATGPAVALWRDRPARPPAASGTLPDRALTLPGTLTVDVSPAFVDPDGDRLTYAVSSSAPQVVTVLAAGARVTLTAVGVGRATIEVTATDPGGLSATQAFTVTVVVTVTGGFTDDPIVAGVTPVRAVHFTELRAHIDALREEAGLGRFRWTDPVLRAGMTPVRLVHLLELREALGAAYTAAGRAAPRWTDAAPTAGTTPIRAAHLTELRAAVVALE